MISIVTWVRKLLGMCDHQWKVVKTIQLAEFDNKFSILDDDEVVSMRDFEKFQCQKCQEFRFKKI